MELKDLPQEIRELAIDRADFSASQIKEDEGLDSLFDWSESPEGIVFWDSIDQGNFSTYYEKYGRDEKINLLEERIKKIEKQNKHFQEALKEIKYELNEALVDLGKDRDVAEMRVSKLNQIIKDLEENDNN